MVIPVDGVTLFVGPNNSGKSLLLRELSQAVAAARTGQILKSFDPGWKSTDDFAEEIRPLVGVQPGAPFPQTATWHRFSASGDRAAINLDINTILQAYDARQLGMVTSRYWTHMQILLDGRTRFNLTNDRKQGELTEPPSNIFVEIFQNDALRRRIRDILHDAFGLYFVLDPTNGGQLRIRFSDSPPNLDEQSLNKAARDFYSAATYVKEAGDGIQAFTGILIALLAGSYELTLIDEPEAFLHPPLARRIGHELTSHTTKDGRALLTSTHSADFLLGCLQASSSIRIVRLEYAKGKSKGRLIDAKQLGAFFKKPLIRSANVLSALFYDGVVVTESDNDRAFYSEIFYRLSEADKNFPSILFVNAQNIHTLHEIVGPLRSFGVPAVAVPDIDLLRVAGSTFTNILTAARIPGALHLGHGQTRGQLSAVYKTSGLDMKHIGVDGLPAEHRNAANTFFDGLDQYGLFAVRRGELERWLSPLGVSGKGTDWTIAMLEKLGSDPTQSTYQKPTGGDVWEFMRRIVTWIRDPARKGMP